MRYSHRQLYGWRPSLWSCQIHHRISQGSLYKVVGSRFLNHVQLVDAARVSGYLSEILFSRAHKWAIDFTQRYPSAAKSL
jgi:hypothetical protein